jgi:hypothetical protein
MEVDTGAAEFGLAPPVDSAPPSGPGGGGSAREAVDISSMDVDPPDGNGEGDVSEEVGEGQGGSISTW